ncbi:hypothetical protein C8R45DRAFT_306912 [Mycena sanguinolenta]|nr:hypothetical protein C8R45DRAFT_306912 [Mycena sanguinolenta]
MYSPFVPSRTSTRARQATPSPPLPSPPLHSPSRSARSRLLAPPHWRVDSGARHGPHETRKGQMRSQGSHMRAPFSPPVVGAQRRPRAPPRRGVKLDDAGEVKGGPAYHEEESVADLWGDEIDHEVNKQIVGPETVVSLEETCGPIGTIDSSHPRSTMGGYCSTPLQVTIASGGASLRQPWTSFSCVASHPMVRAISPYTE